MCPSCATQDIQTTINPMFPHTDVPKLCYSRHTDHNQSNVPSHRCVQAMLLNTYRPQSVQCSLTQMCPSCTTQDLQTTIHPMFPHTDVLKLYNSKTYRPQSIQWSLTHRCAQAVLLKTYRPQSIQRSLTQMYPSCATQDLQTTFNPMVPHTQMCPSCASQDLQTAINPTFPHTDVPKLCYSRLTDHIQSNGPSHTDVPKLCFSRLTDRNQSNVPSHRCAQAVLLKTYRPQKILALYRQVYRAVMSQSLQQELQQTSILAKHKKQLSRSCYTSYVVITRCQYIQTVTSRFYEYNN